MGIRAATIKTGFKNQSHLINEIDNPYSHLAVSIILQAYDDLKALDGQEREIIIGQNVEKWEVVNFFYSDWCGFLLSCQSAISHDRLKEVIRTMI